MSLNYSIRTAVAQTTFAVRLPQRVLATRRRLPNPARPFAPCLPSSQERPRLGSAPAPRLTRAQHAHHQSRASRPLWRTTWTARVLAGFRRYASSLLPLRVMRAASRCRTSFPPSRGSTHSGSCRMYSRLRWSLSRRGMLNSNVFRRWAERSSRSSWRLAVKCEAYVFQRGSSRPALRSVASPIVPILSLCSSNEFCSDSVVWIVVWIFVRTFLVHSHD